jgi:ankyrin repeat protein
MGNSGSTSSGLAKGEEFTDKLLYVQHLDKDRETASEISELCIKEFLLAHRFNFDDPIFMKYLKSPNENLSILKWSLRDSYARIEKVAVYSNPLSSIVPSLPENDVSTIHAFVVFKMRHHYLFQPWEPSEKKPWFEEEKEGILETIWWSLEKNGKYIVLQQSPNKNDVINKIYDTEKKISVERLGPIKKEKSQSGKRDGRAEDLFQVIWNYNQFSEPYNVWTSNCQNFVSFIFEKSTGKKWSAPSSSAIFTPENKEIQSGIKVDARKYRSIIDDLNFDFYRAMIEGRREDFVELYNFRCHNLPDELRVEFLNDVDSQGNTLLEWGTAFSSSDWPIKQFLEDKGAEIRSDEGLFRRNIFFIALQYLPNKKIPKLSDSSDGINTTSDNTALPYLYGEKWDIVEKILNQFEDDDYNTANSLGETPPLILAAKFKCEDKLFTKILQRTNPENINAQDESGFTALHWAIDEKSETKVKELLNHKDVDFSVKNFYYYTPLHWACLLWKDIPADLFKIILEKSTDVINGKDKYGDTALHCAISGESEIATKELLKHSDVNVDIKNKDHETALSYASKWKDIPSDLFNLILEKSTDLNAQDEDGNTALHCAIFNKSEIATKELLKHKDVNVNVKNNNETTLHLASRWKDIPMDLFKIILKKSTDINAKDKYGDTALHCAIWKKSEIATKELLAHKDVNVNIKNDTYQTALGYVSMWEDIPSDLFNLISERKANKVEKISKMDRLFKYLRNLTVHK